MFRACATFLALAAAAQPALGQASPWWTCVVDYEGRLYFSAAFAGDKQDSVYAAVFGRHVEDRFTGHFRTAHCASHGSSEAAAAALQRDLAAAGSHGEPTGWAP